MSINKSYDITEVQKSWPSGIDMKLDEDIELLSCFKGEPELDRASKVLKQERTAKALKLPKKKNPGLERKRAYQLTLNQVERFENLKKYLLGLKNINYMIACQEQAPTTDHPHIHIYCQFTNSQRLARTMIEGAHEEECYGSPEENLDYIYKRGKYAAKKHNPNDEANIIFEWGEIRYTGKKAPSTLAELRTCTDEELMMCELKDSTAVKQEIIRRSSLVKVENWYNPKTIIYLHGESGSGKTEFTKWLMGKMGVTEFENIKKDKDFFHGVAGELETAVYDDFRDSDLKPNEFIHLIDYNSHTMNVKYSSFVNKYKTIMITSVQSPRNLWAGIELDKDERKEQWIRRISKCYYLEKETLKDGTEIHHCWEENPKTGETIKEITSFQEHMKEIKKKKEKENKILDLLNELI